MAFSKLPKNRTFNYKPRFYDPKKEELDRIVSNAKKQAGLEKDDFESMKSRIRAGMKKNAAISYRAPRKAIIKSNIRLFVIIIFLLALVLAFLSSNITNILELVD